MGNKPDLFPHQKKAVEFMQATQSKESRHMTGVLLGHTFQICANRKGKVTELFANGFLYHTLDLDGNCLIGQQYLTLSEYQQNFVERPELVS